MRLDAANGRANKMADKIDALFVSNEKAKELARAMAREAMEKMKAQVSQPWRSRLKRERQQEGRLPSCG